MARLNVTVVSAGAGSGKTHHIETTLKAGIEDGSVRPERIVAVTFTEAAAAELRLRVRQALLAGGMLDQALSLDRAYISTIHGFGARLLREHAFAAGLSPAPRLLNDDEKNLLLRMELAHSEALDAIARDLPRFGYAFDFMSGRPPEQIYRDDVAKFIDRIQSLGDRGLDPDLIANARAWLADKYGPTTATGLAAAALREAAVALTTAFPGGVAGHAKSPTGNAAFRTDHQALAKARTPGRLASDWRLWKALAGMRVKKKGDTVPDSYVVLAERVVELASCLPRLDGPLLDAQAHAGALIGGVQAILRGYTAKKHELQVQDYADMVAEAEALLRNHPGVCDIFATGIDCLVIDEFQDTNPIQFALMWHVISRGVRTIIVGDVKQAIMRFQGADARLMQELLVHDGVRVERLPANYRSAPGIVAFINAIGAGLFKAQYDTQTPTQLEPPQPPLEAIVFSEKPPHGSGIALAALRASHVAARIRELLDGPDRTVHDKRLGRSRPIEPRDIAVLCRTKRELATYAATLREYGIEAQLDAGNWFATDEVQIIVHAASYLINTQDRHAALYLATSSRGGMSLETALKCLARGTPIPHTLLEQLAGLAPQLAPLTVDALIIHLIKDLDLYNWALRQPDPARARANIVRFEEAAREFVATDGDMLAAAGLYGSGIPTFLSWLRHRAETPDLDGQPAVGTATAVELVTWHSAKGREWPVVFVCQIEYEIGARLPSQSLEYALFDDLENALAGANLYHVPDFAAAEQSDNFKALLDPAELDDARRLLYVALTRARETLILEWPAYLFAKKTAEDIKPCFARLLAVECGVTIGAGVVSCDGAPLPMRLTQVPAGQLAPRGNHDAETAPARQGIGRVAIAPGPARVPFRLDMIVPSTRQPQLIGIDKQAMTVHPYADPLHVPLSLFEKKPVQSTDIGHQPTMDMPYAATWSARQARGAALHYCARTLLVRPDLAGQVFDAVGVTLPADMRSAIQRSVAGLRKLLDSLSISIIGTELPILALRRDGAVIHGVVDVLGNREDGVFILDHKSGQVGDPKYASPSYTWQISAYVDAVAAIYPGVRFIDAGINWLSLGVVALFERKAMTVQ